MVYCLEWWWKGGGDRCGCYGVGKVFLVGGLGCAMVTEGGGREAMSGVGGRGRVWWLGGDWGCDRVGSGGE